MAPADSFDWLVTAASGAAPLARLLWPVTVLVGIGAAGLLLWGALLVAFGWPAVRVSRRVGS